MACATSSEHYLIKSCFLKKRLKVCWGVSDGFRVICCLTVSDNSSAVWAVQHLADCENRGVSTRRQCFVLFFFFMSLNPFAFIQNSSFVVRPMNRGQWNELLSDVSHNINFLLFWELSNVPEHKVTKLYVKTLSSIFTLSLFFNRKVLRKGRFLEEFLLHWPRTFPIEAKSQGCTTKQVLIKPGMIYTLLSASISSDKLQSLLEPLDWPKPTIYVLRCGGFSVYESTHARLELIFRRHRC